MLKEQLEHATTTVGVVPSRVSKMFLTLGPLGPLGPLETVPWRAAVSSAERSLATALAVTSAPAVHVMSPAKN